MRSPVTGLPVFRIEDGGGRVLRRIGGARDANEAIARHWRIAAADARLMDAMPDEPPDDATLRRRIDRARAARTRGPAGRAAMMTHELPLPAPEGAAEASGPGPSGVSRRAGRDRRRADAAPPPGQDLFGATAEVGSAEPGPAAHGAPEPAPPPAPPPALPPALPPAPPPEPEPEATEPEPPRPRGAYHLDPRTVPLQPVDLRTMRPTDRPDAHLYHVGTRLEADGTLRDGLAVNPQDPVILTERPGVAYWLSMMAEDCDVILDGPTDFVVLRVRRHAVEGMLEPDPDASRSAGCACYLLTGGGAD